MITTTTDPKTYAFIDVQNTETTAEQVLGFAIDWMKLCEYLKNSWECKEIRLYAGLDAGDIERKSVFDSLMAAGFSVESKHVSAYRNRDRTISIVCPGCKEAFDHKVYAGYNYKANCDVELTADAMEQPVSGDVFLIFTGDGDFEYLIRKIIGKGIKVYVISSNTPIKRGGVWNRRLSSKLRKLSGANQGAVSLVDINSWRAHICRDINVQTATISDGLRVHE